MPKKELYKNEVNEVNQLKNLNETNIHTFLLNEYNQAWEHYRHVENQRSKIMNYFYTIIIALTAFVVNLMKDIGIIIPSNLYFGFGTLLFIVFYYVFFSYTSVKKSSLVLRQYENVMDDIRKKCSTKDINLLEFNIRSRIKRSKFDYFFSFQKNSEAILFGGLVFIEILEILLLLKIRGVTTYPVYYHSLNMTYVVLSIILLLVAVLYSHKHK